MSPDQLLTGPPATMTNAQPMRQPQFSERAEAFQMSLQRTGGKSNEEIKRMDDKAAKERAKYKRWKK